MALEDILDYSIRVAKQVSLTLAGTGDLFFGRHGSLRSLIFLTETGNVPYTDGKVHRGGDDQVVPRVELGAHDVVVVPGKDGNTSSRLPVPNPDSLVVGGRDDPRVFPMEENSSDIVQMASQSKEAFSLFIIPHLDLVVITTGTEDRLSGMEADTSNRAIMLIISVYQSTHLVIP